MKKYVLYFKGNAEFPDDLCYHISDTPRVFIAQTIEELTIYLFYLMLYSGTKISDYEIYELVPAGLD